MVGLKLGLDRVWGPAGLAARLTRLCAREMDRSGWAAGLRKRRKGLGQLFGLSPRRFKNF
jgi:hypothetical protein